jgi:enoyl-CoA hydratase
MVQLGGHIDAIGNDDSIKAAVITGFGTKAFVSGADIGELAALPDAQAAVDKCLRGQKILRAIETLGKPVVAAFNGLAFGGGNELAMSCSARLAVQGHRALVGQPEPRLGIIPGYGGTQRLPRWIGVEAAWPILRNASPISTEKAVELGLVQKTASWENLLDTAVDFAAALADGKEKMDPIPADPIEVPENLPDVDIGHLSKKTDEILRKAILEGARVSLDQGLELEAKYFGDCLATEDMKIGMENFMKHGPKKNAEFVHK